MVDCKLLHHAAAASSSSKVLDWLCNEEEEEEEESHSLVYASHAIVNIAHRPTTVATLEPVWQVATTLRTHRTSTVITALKCVRFHTNNWIVCGFSNGALSLWQQRQQPDEWVEHDLPMSTALPSITDLDARILLNSTIRLALVSCSSVGCWYHLFQQHNDEWTLQQEHCMSRSTMNVVSMFDHSETTWIAVGTAAPRHNSIHLYQFQDTTVHYCGHLLGHEDWITSFAVQPSSSNILRLASASQDAKIRLWKLTTLLNAGIHLLNDNHPSNDDDDSSSLGDSSVEEEEEGEARLEFVNHSNDSTMTSVTLEALLIGHEESVTSIRWYPTQSQQVLVSSSRDRTVFLWSPDDDGVWTPLTRVGSAGGILGGSVGSTLLGYVNVVVEPNGRTLIGQAHGGALHTWSLLEFPSFRATPSLTGHFQGVVDLCWEAESGLYLLTVSADQTCRQWTPVPTGGTHPAWLELARPQVHGYDLTAVTSLSTRQHLHWMVSGADEKELRVLDAPKTTTRLLQTILGVETRDDVERVDRAYIPSLGLSNKATAAEGAEEQQDDLQAEQPTPEEETQNVRLPVERDLGAVMLWPEIRKLFGHNTEIYCLDSTTAASSSWIRSNHQIDLVASSAKARDVEAAAIRLWNVREGTCVQVLSGGHKSTVATLSFSADGDLLASSGKDRRLCIWKRRTESVKDPFYLASALDSAHKRIVWGVHFCPFAPRILASGSRDGNVKIWKINDSVRGDEGTAVELIQMHSFAPTFRTDKKAEAVTALAFAPCPLDGMNNSTALLGLGLECGLIELWKVPLVDSSTPELLLCLPKAQCHAATVTKLAWQPYRTTIEPGSEIQMRLASCSMDQGCRIFEINTLMQ